MPSFAQSPWQNEPLRSLEQPHRPNIQQHNTAYLDGLRGLAAFIVYIFHFLVPFDRSLFLGYMPGDQSSSILGLPIIGLLRSGEAMVRIFFVISGYVLTISASKSLYSRDWDGLLRSLSVATLKRGIRLFVPAVTASFIIMLLAHGGFYTDAAILMRFPAHRAPLQPAHKSPFGAQVLDWLDFVFGRLTNPWQWQGELFSNPDASYYGAHLWTIQAEFHCSLILFLIAMALSRVPKLRARATVLAGIMLYSVLWGRWDIALFLCGMAFADADVRSTAATVVVIGQLCTDKPCRLEVRLYLCFLHKAGHIVALVAGIWLASYPEKRGAEAVGFGLLGRIYSSEQLWQATGAALIVWSVRRVRLAHALLTISPVQYLGQVSFALYIVHEPLLQSFGWLYTNMLRRYFMLAGARLGFSIQVGARVGIILGFISLTPAVLLVSDYVWRGLDKPSIGLVREIGRRM